MSNKDAKEPVAEAVRRYRAIYERITEIRSQMRKEIDDVYQI